MGGVAPAAQGPLGAQPGGDPAARPGTICSPLTIRLPLSDTSKLREACRSRTSRDTVPRDSKAGAQWQGSAGSLRTWALLGSCLTGIGQDSSLMHRHVLKHHGQPLHDLARGTCQSLPDQAQVAGGREEDAAIDAVVHQVVVRGLGAGVCGGWALVPAWGRGCPRPAPAPPQPPLTDVADGGRGAVRAAGEVIGGGHVPGLTMVPLDVRGDERGPPGYWKLHGWKQAVGVDAEAEGA